LPFKFLIALLVMAWASLAGAQTIQPLCSFNGANGANPGAPLTLANDGNFYGTTFYGGASGAGTVFGVTTNGTLTPLASFIQNSTPYPSRLTVGPDGNFYGTTSSGGSDSEGSVFQVMTDGTLTTLFSFTGGVAMSPSLLTLGLDGNFYGTTFDGGEDYGGTVFRVDTNGTLTTLDSFFVTNGANPPAGLTLGQDGNFYGTTYYGGITDSGNHLGWGTIFRLDTNGNLTTLASFNGTNGVNPSAALTLSPDGTFYGTAAGGGSEGTIFEVTTNGTLIPFASFNGAEVPINCQCSTALAFGNDGNLYGTTYSGGIGLGSIFQATTNGTLTTLAVFQGTNGSYPNGLTLGNDGNFYGSTYYGGNGSPGYGTVFRLLLPLAFVAQPQNVTNTNGASITFVAAATSPLAVTYQWQRNNTNLVNAGNLYGVNTTRLTIAGISDSDAGS